MRLNWQTLSHLRGRGAKYGPYVGLSLAIAFSLQACLSVELNNPDAHKKEESPQIRVEVLSPNASQGERQVAPIAIVAGGGVSEGDGIQVVSTVGEHVVGGSGNVGDGDGELRVTPGVQGAASNVAPLKSQD